MAKRNETDRLGAVLDLVDVGNSAFCADVRHPHPIFFNALAEEGGLSSVEYLAYWGYATVW